MSYRYNDNENISHKVNDKSSWYSLHKLQANAKEIYIGRQNKRANKHELDNLYNNNIGRLH